MMNRMGVCIIFVFALSSLCAQTNAGRVPTLEEALAEDAKREKEEAPPPPTISERRSTVIDANENVKGENVIDVTGAGSYMTPGVVISDYHESREEDVPLLRRSETLFFITIPFGALYSGFPVFLLDGGYGTSAIPFIGAYLQNPGELKSTSRNFMIATAVVWAAAIVCSDIEKRLDRDTSLSFTQEMRRTRVASALEDHKPAVTTSYYGLAYSF